jgi:hypothetical protein
MGKKAKHRVRILDKHDNHGSEEVEPRQRSAEVAEAATTSNEKSVDQDAQEASEAIVDLGLDISTSITGVALLDTSGDMVFMGHVPLTSKRYTNLFEKADAALEWMKSNLPKGVKVRRIFVEANAKGFTAGFSSADTLFTLAKMNVLVSYLSHKHFGVPVYDVNVTSARSRIGYKDNRSVKRPVKEKVREFVLLCYPHLPFETREVKVGKNKGTRVPASGAADEIDAWVICRGGQLIVG